VPVDPDAIHPLELWLCSSTSLPGYDILSPYTTKEDSFYAALLNHSLILIRNL
jgi:hypothetical protein